MSVDWDSITQGGGKKGGKDKKSQFRSVTDGLTPETVRSATGREKAQKGRRQYPLTTRLPIELSGEILEKIKRYADELNMAQNDVQLLCLMRGLNSLEDNPPKVEIEPKAKPVLPDLS